MPASRGVWSAYVLTLRSAAFSHVRLRRLFDRIAATPAPAGNGLLARHWRLVGRAACGRYLFRSLEAAHDFVQDPRAQDDAIAWIEEHGDLSTLEISTPVEIPSDVRLDRPVFIVSAPRGGSTLLYEMLSRSGVLWTGGGESHGVIEGIPRLHIATRGFESHRLTAADADAETCRTLRAMFVAELRDCNGRRYLDRSPDERQEGVRLLEKTPENALRIPFLEAAFPGARFVFLRRDVRETVSSMLEVWHHDGFISIPNLPDWPSGEWHLLLPPAWRQLVGRPRLEVAVFQWQAAVQYILDDLARLPRERWCAVDFAELLADPAALLRRLCRFMDVPYDDALASAAAGRLPLSSTTITHPSRGKWRFNREFSEEAVAPLRPLLTRLQTIERGGMTSPRSSAPIRFACFVHEAANLTASIGTRSVRPGTVGDLVVNPSLHLQLGPTVPLAILRRARFRERFLADHPILWIEDPVTRFLCPFWARREDLYLMRQLYPGRRAPLAKAHPLQRALAEAGVLIVPEELDEQARCGERKIDLARQEFATDGVCVLPGLLHPIFREALCRYYRELIASGQWRIGDAQVSLRHGWHNELMARFVHHQLTLVVSRVVGEPAKPSYAYVSAYRSGAVLQRHIDREQCRFTMSLLIDKTCDRVVEDRWPICFDTSHGTLSRTQDIGDAVLFRGCELPHYRTTLADGQTETALLFHYVPEDFPHVLD